MSDARNKYVVAHEPAQDLRKVHEKIIGYIEKMRKHGPWDDLRDPGSTPLFMEKVLAATGANLEELLKKEGIISEDVKIPRHLQGAFIALKADLDRLNSGSVKSLRGQISSSPDQTLQEEVNTLKSRFGEMTAKRDGAYIRLSFTGKEENYQNNVNLFDAFLSKYNLNSNITDCMKKTEDNSFMPDYVVSKEVFKQIITLSGPREAITKKPSERHPSTIEEAPEEEPKEQATPSFRRLGG